MPKPVFIVCPTAPKFQNLNQISVHNDTIYLAGVVGMSDAETIVSGGIVGQTRQIFKNIQNMLQYVGSDLDHIISLNVFLSTNLTQEQEDTFNEIYREIFPVEAERPLRCCVQVKLQEGFDIEVVNIMAAKK
ncbi:Endoribonuclease_L-PSP [Hexamita inflata]|uniref:Endoribonuclease L-PSP n=1 Tax=Hexamita inflata TaxID=28002 RepID=A0AA86Q2Y2_9EUKA|nr:Endoribonuclease L-PSP [Hexamita inflata]CAI9945332.1 Endoribonuclease L-PSP [Hexamita inflata]